MWQLWKKCMVSFPDGFCWTLRENLPTVISFWFGKQSGLPEWYLLAIFICLWLWPLWKITEISFLTETWTLQILSSFLMKWQRSMMEELFCQLLETWYINSKPWFLINRLIFKNSVKIWGIDLLDWFINRIQIVIANNH